ncbi:MAG: GTPase HflX, partial [Oscillospiraceae bacterium]|nr:GTPase HflX [Oscillospiraceae bacterium]
ACDFEVVDVLTQNSDQLHKGHYLGKGKLEELTNAIEEKKIDRAIFYDELTPMQIRNIERYLKCTIMDRTNLILDIFASRAKTKEAKLQVEIAQLQYMLPHLAGSYEDLGRQGGGSGLSNRGAGETKLELDKRKMLQKISVCKNELEKITNERAVRRNLRKSEQVPIVSLVGYTNSGKSTIMNAFVDLYSDNEEKKVFEENMLFATLDTSVRQINIKNEKKFLLTDTVGFVDKLPHKLIKAFRSTLEEILDADVIIHVVDYSNSNYEKQIEVTNNTLAEIGAQDIPIVYAYNKCDLTENKKYGVSENKVYMSARTKAGIEDLIDLITKVIMKDYHICKMLIPFENGNITSYLLENCKINSKEHTEQGTLLELQCSSSIYNKHKQYVLD